MKQSRTFIPTMREIPTDADIVSHQLLLRAGFVRQQMSGVYSYLPLAKKVLRKIENIIREEMEAIDAVELSMPSMQQTELLDETGRLSSYGSDLFLIRDRHDRQIALAPIHEEVITSLISNDIKSYKKLPLTLYEIITMYKDEKRPRFGLIRLREFIKNNIYSFHSNSESLDEKYDDVKNAYSKIFSRLGLEYQIVIADSVSIGSKSVHKFMALSKIGEDTIAYSNSSTYAATIEMAEVNMDYEKSKETLREIEKVKTPNQNTVEEVSTYLEIETSKVIKTLIFKTTDEFIAVLLRGDHKINEVKLRNVLGTKNVDLASETDISELLSCNAGSIGPVKLPLNMKVIADFAIASIVNGVSGANVNGYHLKNVNPERDFAIDEYYDLRLIQENDPSPDGKGAIQFAKAIDLGYVSKLGTTFSEVMKASFVDELGKDKPYVMGCYGLGVSRILAAVAEQYNDANGLKWPKKLAPYDIHLVTVNMEDEVQKQLSNELYHLLKSYRYDILHDDRLERAGVKFADSDLIGLPMRITIGKRAQEGIVEVKFRETGETVEWQREEITEKLQTFFG